MSSARRPPSILVFLCATLFANMALGQSLSILRNGGNEFTIEANAPLETRHVLEASGDCRSWTNINDEVFGQLTVEFDSAGVEQRFFRLRAWTPPPGPITLVLVGDSTVADFNNDNGWFYGWGQGIPNFFNEDVRIVNLAYPCYSSKAFLASAEYQKMLAIKPEFVLLQFGLVDVIGCGGDLSERWVTTMPEYDENLRAIVQAVRDFHGTPILITPPSLARFDGGGNVVPTLPDRCATMRAAAAELQAPLVDLNQLSAKLYARLGVKGSEFIPWNEGNYHYSAKGAEAIAGLVAGALPDSLAVYLKPKPEHPTPP